MPQVFMYWWYGFFGGIPEDKLSKELSIPLSVETDMLSSKARG